MCLTIPGKVIALHREQASIDYGRYGVRENANASMVPVQIGDYVLVQGGFVIKVLPANEAVESLKAWEVVREALDDPEGGLF